MAISISNQKLGDHVYNYARGRNAVTRIRFIKEWAETNVFSSAVFSEKPKHSTSKKDLERQKNLKLFLQELKDVKEEDLHRNELKSKLMDELLRIQI